MIYGPRATELGTLSIGLKFRKLLKLEAWRLLLAACSLLLVACSFLPVTVLHGPCFMDLFYDYSVSHKLRFECL